MRFLVSLVAPFLWICSIGGCHQSLSRSDAAQPAGVDGSGIGDGGHDAGTAPDAALPDGGVDGSGIGDGGHDTGTAPDGRAMGYLGGPCVINAGGADTGGYYLYCYDPAATCDGSVCVPCGGAGQDCCTQPKNGLSWSCGAGLTCDRSVNGGTCTDTCGAEGAACCKYDFCQSAPVLLGCTASDTTGTCQVCGIEGAPCCAGTCPAGLACLQSPPGSSQLAYCTSACGAEGGSCCPGAGYADRCQEGLHLGCAADGTCVSCGGADQPCCNERGVTSACSSGLLCQLAPGSTIYEICSSVSPPDAGTDAPPAGDAAPNAP